MTDQTPDALLLTEQAVTQDIFAAIHEKWVEAMARAPLGYQSAVQAEQPMITEYSVEDGVLRATKIAGSFQVPSYMLEGPDPDWTPPHYSWHVRARRAVRSWWYETRRAVGHWVAPTDSCDHSDCY